MAESPGDCCQQCQSFKNCSFWTYTCVGKAGNCCYLKDSSPHGVNKGSATDVSGSTKPPAPPYAHTGPLTCQDNAKFPMLPTFHIIGNVSQSTDGSIMLEPINDASGVTYYKGLYHVWHQCCQNHWDHVISKDLIHWQRLPPPIQSHPGDKEMWGATGDRTYDGSISMLPMEDGGPIFLYDAPDKIPPGYPGCGECILSIARLNKTDDKYLQLFTRDEGGGDPVVITGQNMTKGSRNGPIDFPSTIWKNGDHYNFIAQGARFTTKDKSFREWTRVVEKDPAAPDMIGCHENGGQWWIPTPNQIGGAPPPAGTPNQLVNCGGGNTYRIGDYFPANESFVWAAASDTGGQKTAQLEYGQAGWWGAQGGAANNDRMMMIGWVRDYRGDAGPGIQFLTRLTLLREVNWDTKTENLVSNPVPELLKLRSATPMASETIPSLAVNAPHIIAKTGGGAAASADIVVKFSGFTNASKGSLGLCVLGNGQGTGNGTSGIGITINLGQNGGPGGVQGVDITSGECQISRGTASYSAGTDAGKSTLDAGKLASHMQLFEDETELTVRVLPDRSAADWFVQGGRWAATDGWQGTEPRKPEDSNVMLWSSAAGVSAQVDVYGMGCGWLNPSYTEHPTL